ncbi:MAG: hypothetical protein AAF492_02985, partial [Verrucomicrobiota bacterium]
NSATSPIITISTVNGLAQTAFGMLDEVRFSRRMRSSNWVHAAWLNTASNETFNQAGPLELMRTNQPVVVTLPPTDLVLGSVSLNGRLVTTGGASTVVFVYYGTNDEGMSNFAWSATNVFSAHSGAVPADYTFSASGLLQNVDYVYRYRATNAFGTWWGEAQWFTALGPPSVDNEPGATGLGPVRATVNGRFLTDNRGDVQIYYGLSDGGTAPAAWDRVADLGPVSATNFSTNLTGLLYGVPYVYRSRATNTYGVGWAASSTNFKALRPAGVDVLNGLVENVTSTSATIHGTAQMTQSIFHVWAYWGTSDGGTNAILWSNAMSFGWFTNVASTNVSASLSGLMTNTTYFWTFRMTNCADDLWASNVSSLKTLGGGLQITNTGASLLSAGQAGLNGRLTDGGGGDITIYFGASDGGTVKAAWDQALPLGNLAEGPFSTSVTGLLYGLPYFYRCYVTNAFGEAWANTSLVFKTLSPIRIPSSIGGLELWLNASTIGSNGNDVVGFWPDDSGNGHHIDNLTGVGSDPTYVSDGLNGRPVVAYDGDDFHFTTHNFNTIGSHTIFSVARYAGAFQERVISSVGGNWLFGYWRNGDERWHAQSWIQMAGTGNTQWHLHEGTMTDDADPRAAFWKDGVPLTTNNIGSSPPHAPFQLSLGGWQNNLNEASQAEVAEVIIYDRVLTGSERLQVVGYLENKYALGTPYTPVTSVDGLEQQPVSDVSTTGAVLNARLEAAGAVFDVLAYWGTTDGGTSAVAWSNSAFIGSFTNEPGADLNLAVSGLASNTLHYFRFRMTNCAEDTWAPASDIFRTVGGAVSVTNLSGATDVSIGGAQLNGRLTDGGAAFITFYFGRTDGGTNKAAWDTSWVMGKANQGANVSQVVSGLYYGVGYYYRTYATNIGGDAWANASVPFKTRPPAFAPDDIGDLALWLNASTIGSNDSDVVAFWPDDSGLGRHIDNLTGVGSDPRFIADGLNGHPVVRYDGDDFHHTTHNFQTIRDHTILSVARYTNPLGPGASERVISSVGGNWLFGFWNRGTRRWHSDAWVVNQVGMNFSEWHLHAGTMRTGVSDPLAAFWDNGQLVVTNSVGSNPPHAPRQLGLGGWNANTVEASEAEVAEVIIFDRVLHADELNRMGSYLQKKYDLPAAYPDFEFGIFSRPADAITQTSADLMADLAFVGSVFDVTLFYGPANAGTNSAGWANAVPLGAYTNISAVVT